LTFHVITGTMYDHMDVVGTGQRYETKRVDELREMDRTPWYTVWSDPEPDEFAQDWYVARVFFIDSEHVGWIHQQGSDLVPVECSSSGSG
jgi:hypothetical protein